MNIIWKLTLLAIIFSSSVSGSKKLYEQSCQSTEDCDKTLGLTCQNRACKCESNGATVYSLTQNRCVGAAGRECLQLSKESNVTLCVENSVCRDYEYMHLCACKDGYYNSKDGNCYTIAKYGETCLEEEFSCGDTLSTSISCVEKKCRCLLGEDNQFFDPKEKKCTSYAGGQCIGHYFQSCSKNAYCGEVQENFQGASFVVGHKCLCGAGYSYTKNKQCLARYGTDCSVNNPCNYDEYLGCVNFKCQCRNPLNEIYNDRTSRCEILVGSVCDTEGSQKCVDNAECQLEKNSTSKHGKCQCKSGYSSTPLNICLLDINQKCDHSNNCNLFNGLACILTNNSNQATCNCVDTYLSYDKVSKACVSLVGLPCGTVSLFDNEQIANNLVVDKTEKPEIIVLCEANASCSKIGSSNNVKRVCKPLSGAKH